MAFFSKNKTSVSRNMLENYRAYGRRMERAVVIKGGGHGQHMIHPCAIVLRFSHSNLNVPHTKLPTYASSLTQQNQFYPYHLYVITKLILLNGIKKELMDSIV